MTGCRTGERDRGSGELLGLRNALRQFAADRDWDQFHSPKNLAMAVTVEATELLEHFQWLKEGSAAELGPEKLLECEPALKFDHDLGLTSVEE